MNDEAVIFGKLAAVKLEKYTQGLQELLVVGVLVSILILLLRWRILPPNPDPGLHINTVHNTQTLIYL